ncbi:MAG: hypothetical protein HY858_10295 [Candidatus Solibacter usitatus]|nr:hypothetical protein [Candidatus Solibacter usitatus]
MIERRSTTAETRTQAAERFFAPRGWRLARLVAMLALAGIGLGYCQSSYMRRVRQAPAVTGAVPEP